ncbi:MAG: thiopurine S-methyltransferase, partial [Pseudomonadota bacterium]
DGSALLRRHWPRLVRGSRVLVPFCGKSVDMLWLAGQGLDVTGVEVSPIAARAFFEENDLEYRLESDNGATIYTAQSAPLRIWCGDYFNFVDAPHQALYDRGALVAVAPADRDRYVEATKRLLETDAFRLVITLRYDQSAVAGPPFSMDDSELLDFWPDLKRAQSRDDLQTASPKFRAAGLTEVIESVWTSA